MQNKHLPQVLVANRRLEWSRNSLLRLTNINYLLGSHDAHVDQFLPVWHLSITHVYHCQCFHVLGY